MQIIHLVPHLPPNIDGLGDYAVTIGRRLTEIDPEIRCAYLSAGYAAGPLAPDPGLDAVDVSGRACRDRLSGAVDDLCGAGEDRAILVLHFVGYGYQKRGCPMWLPAALDAVRSARPEMSFITVFHELYAFGRPWQSSFWLSPVQRFVTAALLRRSTAALTSRSASAAWLRAQGRDAAPLIRVQPIFSNVGEPAALPPHEARAPQAVVFGSAGMRARLYRRYGALLGPVLAEAGIHRLLDIGAPVPGELLRLPGLAVEPLGLQPAAVVSRALQGAAVGVLAYPGAYLTKSGILAAYLAHGLPTILAGGGNPAGPLVAGRHYLALEALGRGASGLTAPRCASIGRQGRQWYDAHAHSRIAARRLLGLVQSPIRNPEPQPT